MHITFQPDNFTERLNMSTPNYIGALILSAVVAFPVFQSGSLTSFINLPAAIVIIMGVAGAVLFSANPGQTQAGKLNAIGQGAWISGIVACIGSLVIVLTNLAEPESIGPNLAVSLMSMLYGATVRLFCSIFSLRQT